MTKIQRGAKDFDLTPACDTVSVQYSLCSKFFFFTVNINKAYTLMTAMSSAALWFPDLV